MEIVFYLASLIAISATIRVITHTNPIHALLYLIIMLLAVSTVFFSLGAYFSGALEIIVYAGAIMVLFVFVVMMLNLGRMVHAQELEWTKPSEWLIPGLISLLLLIVLMIAICGLSNQDIISKILDAKIIGITLFGPYILAVELASILLLSGLIVTYHIGRENKPREMIDVMPVNDQIINGISSEASE